MRETGKKESIQQPRFGWQTDLGMQAAETSISDARLTFTVPW
jgi:hypothetical protein